MSDGCVMANVSPLAIAISKGTALSGAFIPPPTAMLLLPVLAPKLSILDETDSGLDIDALKIVADGVNTLRNKENSFLIITHYQRLLDYIKPDYVHVLMNGKIIKSGGPELALELEKKGYKNFN